MEQISFVVRESLHDALMAAGIDDADNSKTAVCPYVVGDFISFPPAPGLFFQVRWRVHQEAKGWLVGLEPCEDPMKDW